MDTRLSIRRLGLTTGDAAPLVGNAPERFFRLVSERERVSSSGWRFGVAVPYARVDGLSRPMVAIGRTERGMTLIRATADPQS